MVNLTFHDVFTRAGIAFGRWRQHASGAARITVGLAPCDPRSFHFSTLERTSQTADPRHVIVIEQTWMDRLDTVRFGLNPLSKTETPDVP